MKREGFQGVWHVVADESDVQGLGFREGFQGVWHVVADGSDVARLCRCHISRERGGK